MPSLTQSARRNHKNIGFRIVKNYTKYITGGSFFSHETTLAVEEWNIVKIKSTAVLDIIGFRLIKTTNSKGEKS